MRSLRAAVPLAIAASVIAVAPAAADAKAPSTAKASGGDAVELTYPSIVRIRVARATDLTVGGRRLLNAADAQITRTRAFVNTNWPPVPEED